MDNIDFVELNFCDVKETKIMLEKAHEIQKALDGLH